MAQWFETKLRYDKLCENGEVKKVNEPYLVDALSFAEAEARITEEKSPLISGDFTVSAVKKVKISEVIGDMEASRFYLAKVGFVTIDEKSGIEKTIVTQLLVGDEDFQGAFGALLLELRGSMSDWKILSLTETGILEVYPARLSSDK